MTTDTAGFSDKTLGKSPFYPPQDHPAAHPQAVLHSELSNMIRIDAVITERVLVPIRQEWLIKGRGIHDQSPFLLVRLKCGDIEGVGEVSGTYRWSGEEIGRAHV